MRLLTHQLLLNSQDTCPGCLTVGLLACDDDHLRVTVLSRQVDLGVSFLTNLGTWQMKGTFRGMLRRMLRL